MAVRVTNDTFFEEVLSFNGAVLADFYSDSCIPCKRLSPVLAELEEELQDKIKLVKININFDLELASEYEVQTVPTLVFFKNGREVSRLNGLVKKDEIVSEIENL
ncbi:MAG: thioredoxin fold domain-containing protein [Ruminococcus sp.]|nr:thioredoxin fold domain-containing protein [Ruminococcus sp.]